MAMVLMFVLIMILVITLPSLRITAIYFNRIVYHNLLYTGVLVSVWVLLVGSGVGDYEGLFQVTTITQSMDKFIYLIGALVLLLVKFPTLISKGKGLPVLAVYSLIVLFTVLGMSSLISSSELVHMFLSIELQSFAVYIYNEVISVVESIYNFIFSSFIVSCEGAEDLPRVLEFKDLHLTETLREAKEVLRGQSGIYCFVCQETGAMYIGSSCDMSQRLMDHVFNNGSNLHLQRAIARYGLPVFVFIVIEFSNPFNLLSREQVWLDWLFSLPSALRFNFSPTAGSTLGYKHTEETKQKIGLALRGENNPFFGKLPANTQAVLLIDLTLNMTTEFASMTALGAHLSTSQLQIAIYIQSGKVFREKYLILRKS